MDHHHQREEGISSEQALLQCAGIQHLHLCEDVFYKQRVQERKEADLRVQTSGVASQVPKPHDEQQGRCWYQVVGSGERRRLFVEWGNTGIKVGGDADMKKEG